jgi:hypothetical protein
MYVEGRNPRRTPLIGKIAIYGWNPVNRYGKYRAINKGQK